MGGVQEHPACRVEVTSGKHPSLHAKNSWQANEGGLSYRWLTLVRRERGLKRWGHRVCHHAEIECGSLAAMDWRSQEFRRGLKQVAATDLTDKLVVL